MTTDSAAPVVIKKYSNRRLYNTQTSMYITLDDVRQMVCEGTELEVRDAKSGEDITRQILTQIIFEQELNGAQGMLPVNVLKRMITMYDNKMGEVFPYYLEGSMEAFIANQEKIREQFGEMLGQYNPMKQFEDMRRKNVEIMQNAFQMFNPFEYMSGAARPQGQDASTDSDKGKDKNNT
jgi:polyhydroxyalkanoate synthesis repressor PhaR